MVGFHFHRLQSPISCPFPVVRTHQRQLPHPFLPKRLFIVPLDSRCLVLPLSTHVCPYPMSALRKTSWCRVKYSGPLLRVQGYCLSSDHPDLLILCSIFYPSVKICSRSSVTQTTVPFWRTHIFLPQPPVPVIDCHWSFTVTPPINQCLRNLIKRQCVGLCIKRKGCFMSPGENRFPVDQVLGVTMNLEVHLGLRDIWQKRTRIWRTISN